MYYLIQFPSLNLRCQCGDLYCIQFRELRPREVMYLAHSHTAGRWYKWQSQDPGSRAHVLKL